MAIDPMAAINQMTSIRPPETATSGAKLGKDVFMKLLVAQLKYQNPMDPVNGNEFVAQSAQFSVVEQLEEMAKATKLQADLDSRLTATSMLGKKVSYPDPAAAGAEEVVQSGVVTGVRFGPDGTVLVLGSKEVLLTRITAVATPTTTTSSTKGSTPTS